LSDDFLKSVCALFGGREFTLIRCRKWFVFFQKKSSFSFSNIFDFVFFIKSNVDRFFFVNISSLGYWTFDMREIQQVPCSNEVVDFLVGRLQTLSDSAKVVVHHGACLGNRFSEEMITLISHEDIRHVSDDVTSQTPSPSPSVTTAEIHQVCFDCRMTKFDKATHYESKQRVTSALHELLSLGLLERFSVR
jgi:hypothetical protein